MGSSSAAYVDTRPAVVHREPVHCACGRKVFDGIAITSRVVRVLPYGGAQAKCRCKRWVRVPVSYDASQLVDKPP